MLTSRSPLIPTDPASIAIAEHLQKMQANGHGQLRIEAEGSNIKVSFGPLSHVAETCDIGLVRLAGLVLDDPVLSAPFLTVLRGWKI